MKSAFPQGPESVTIRVSFSSLGASKLDGLSERCLVISFSCVQKSEVALLPRSRADTVHLSDVEHLQSLLLPQPGGLVSPAGKACRLCRRLPSAEARTSPRFHESLSTKQVNLLKLQSSVLQPTTHLHPQGTHKPATQFSPSTTVFPHPCDPLVSPNQRETNHSREVCKGEEDGNGARLPKRINGKSCSTFLQH